MDEPEQVHRELNVHLNCIFLFFANLPTWAVFHGTTCGKSGAEARGDARLLKGNNGTFSYCRLLDGKPHFRYKRQRSPASSRRSQKLATEATVEPPSYPMQPNKLDACATTSWPARVYQSDEKNRRDLAGFILTLFLHSEAHCVASIRATATELAAGALYRNP